MRFANAYFLLVAILQTIKSISITNGVPTNFIPLSIVLLFDGLVTAREDYKRHVDDSKANCSEGEGPSQRTRAHTLYVVTAQCRACAGGGVFWGWQLCAHGYHLTVCLSCVVWCVFLLARSPGHAGRVVRPRAVAGRARG